MTDEELENDPTLSTVYKRLMTIGIISIGVIGWLFYYVSNR